MPMIEILAFPFAWKALVAGTAVALCCGTLGLFLVLRRYSMIGDGLAHVGLAAVALGLFLGITPLWVAIPVTVLASLWITELGEKSGVYGETAVGLVSSVSVAAAVLLASAGNGFSVDLMSYLFGSVLAVRDSEVIVSVLTSILVVSLVVGFRLKFFALAYDPDYAKVSGLKAKFLERFLVALAALAVAIGIRVVGALLVSSLVVFPAVTALLFGRGFRFTLAASAVIAVVTTVAGILVSFAFDLPAGASIVMVNFLTFSAVWAFSRLGTGKNH